MWHPALVFPQFQKAIFLQNEYHISSTCPTNMCPSNPALSFNLKVVKTGPDTFSWKYRELHENSCLCQMDVFKATVEQHVGDSNATESDSMLVRANACTEKLVNFLLIPLQ